MKDPPKVSPQDHIFLGVDVQFRRPCTYYALDGGLDLVDSGILVGESMDEICQDLRSLAEALLARGQDGLRVGIDAPRLGLPAPRQWYWRKGGWEARRGQRGFGRHCEVVVKALGLGNPQWTRLAADSPPWMRLGFRLYAALEGLAETHEVFPSATYRMLEAVDHPPVALRFTNFAGQAKDMLDACAAAYTVWAFKRGRGCEVGGGDGLGTIVLPEKVGVTHSVMHWPE